MTGLIAVTETVNRGNPDPSIMKKAADVVLRFIGNEVLGRYLIHEDGDESLIL